MGSIFKNVSEFVNDINEDEVLLEIGSDRWEGSTAFFAELAHLHNSHLHTVDIQTDIGPRLEQIIPSPYNNCYTFYNTSGEAITSNWNKKIRVLYLDNFDWDWNIRVKSDMIAEQKVWYREQGLTMNNINSQISHLTQAINLTPWLTRRSIIAIDDTYLHNGTFTGKGGAVVPYLMMQGFDILKIHDNGLIMGCDFENVGDLEKIPVW